MKMLVQLLIDGGEELVPEIKLSPRISACLDDELKFKIWQYTRANGMTYAELVKKALAEYVGKGEYRK